MAITAKPVLKFKKGDIVHITGTTVGNSFPENPEKKAIVLDVYSLEKKYYKCADADKHDYGIGYVSEVDMEPIEADIDAVIDSEAIPSAISDGFVSVDGVYVHEETLSIMEAAIANDEATLLIGETGTGKTSLIAALARKASKELVRISVSGTTGAEEILGKFLVKDGATYWQDGMLTQAMRRGAWVVMDEINAALPEVLFALHSLLDHDKRITLAEKDGETVRPSGGFRFFATMNPPEEYAGTKDMNRALLSRFGAVVHVDVAPVQYEEKALREQSGASAKDASRLLSVAAELRKAKAERKIFYFCSTRDLIQAAKLSKYVPLDNALRACVLNKMSSDEVKEVEKVVVSLAKKRSVSALADIIAECEALREDNERKKAALKKARAELATLGSDTVTQLKKMLKGATAT